MIPVQTRRCVVCYAEFESGDHRQRCCSTECRAEFQTLLAALLADLSADKLDARNARIVAHVARYVRNRLEKSGWEISSNTLRGALFHNHVGCAQCDVRDELWRCWTEYWEAQTHRRAREFDRARAKIWRLTRAKIDAPLKKLVRGLLLAEVRP